MTCDAFICTQALTCDVWYSKLDKVSSSVMKGLCLLYYLLGLLCQLDDACISNPCKKGSNCDTNPVNGNHFCTCPTGYIGASCDQDFDECSLGKSRYIRAANNSLGLKHSLAILSHRPVSVVSLYIYSTYV